MTGEMSAMPLENRESTLWMPAGLTPREREVLELVAQGLTDRGISEVLVLSPRTVNSHVAKILRKYGASTRSEVVAKATRLGDEDR